jgi:prepilin signal peptidase PulO-like enzyme (type II secretory pathway)
VGDAKLCAAAGGWLGWQALPLVLLIAAGGALAWLAAQGAARRGRPVAFGPWIALGWAVIWLAAPLAGR